VKPYHLESRAFAVKPWSGITVDDVRAEPDGTVSFEVGPRHTYPEGEVGPIDYPDTYKSPVRFVRDQRTAVVDPAAPNDPAKVEWYCLTCSFRPWLDAGDATSATVTFVGADGRRSTAGATERDGRWYTTRALAAGESAYVAAGDVRDEFGDVNGNDSARTGL
jgi:hypothetical protein